MLRKVLAEAEASFPEEQESLVPPDSTTTYGTSTATKTEEETKTAAVASLVDFAFSSDDGEDDDDEDDSDEDDSLEEEDEDLQQNRSMIWYIWRSITEAVRLVANVDNLWDSPVLNEQRVFLPTYDSNSNGYNDNTSSSLSPQRRNKLLVLFWFVVVATSYAGERSSFKWLVDRTGPFRLVMVQIVVLANAFIMGLVYIFTKRKRALGVSVVDVCVMAVLDTMALIIMFIAGAEVTPTLTVILLQWNIPLMAFWSRNGLAVSHLVGSAILTLAVALALVPAVISLVNPDFFLYADAIPFRTAVQSLFYVSSCIPAAASQLYKEHVFLAYKQPVNMELLNMLLSIFQFILASILSPLALVLQGMGFRDDWTHAYQSSRFGDNAMDAIRCFFGKQIVGDYPEDATCSYVGTLVLFHVLSVVSVGVAVDRIVNAGATKVMYRGISAGIILAVLVMHVYDMRTPTFNYGTAVDALNLTCLVMLIVGTEIYHRSGIPNSTFETIYPPTSLPDEE